MNYYFQDVQRWQLLFDSPNKLAAFLCLNIPLLIVAVGFLKEKKRRSFAARSVVTILSVLIVVCEFLLVKTYSRGGYIAFVIGLSIVWLLGHRKSANLFTCVFVLLLMIIPKASIRAMSFDVINDSSIWNRLVLWKSVCEICVDNFLFGVWRSVGEVFGSWYQPIECTQVYLTAVNDYLTIGARYGMLLLGSYLFVLFFVFALLIRKSINEQSQLSVGILSSVVSYSVASFFSTFYTTVLLMCYFSFLLVLGFVISAHMRQKGALVCASLMSIALCAIIYAVGAYARMQRHYIYEYRSIEECEYVMVKISGIPIRETIIYIFDKNERTIEVEAKCSIRHLLKPGIAVVALGVDSSISGYEVAKALITRISTEMKNKRDLSLVGQNCGGRFAFMLGQEFPCVRKVAAIGAYAEWPIASLSPTMYTKGRNKPEVWVIGGDSDWRMDIEQCKRLVSICAERNISCRLIIQTGVGNELEHWRTPIFCDIADWIH